ncbi:MAG: winged helix-turn-helix domain-containing protein [Ardenticatenales bacterium]|nr:winged helix-turn-helix domain-containing protein [Ardenticatenales bacterium]
MAHTTLSHRPLTPTLARRLAITRQRLAGPRPTANAAGLLEVVRDLGCLQLDPISAVARSHQIVLWSRVGPYDLAEVDHLLWKERALFEYWAHCASIVLTEDFPIHEVQMRGHGRGESSWGMSARAWQEENKELQAEILTRLATEGPLLAKNFSDRSLTDWESSGWTGGRNVSRMLDFLWGQGTILVHGRTGIQRHWALAEHCLPEWTPRETLTPQEMVRRAAQKSLRALGVGTQAHIREHFVRGCYPGLKGVLKELEEEGRIVQVQLQENGQSWPDSWYLHADDLPLVEQLESGEWEPRTTLLSPFDNLLCDRKRTELLWNFRFRIEIYVPEAKREFGYYVLPILHGDRLIGRIDPKMDRKRKTLTVNTIYAEPDAPMTLEAGRGIAAAIAELAQFLGAKHIVYPKDVPPAWAGAFQ